MGVSLLDSGLGSFAMRRSRPRSTRLRPAADHPADLVDGAGGVLVSPHVEMALLVGETHKKAQLFEPQIGAGEMGAAVAGLGGLDQRFENVECGRLDAVAEQELLCFRKTPNSLDQPVDELIVGFQCWSGAAGVIGHARKLPLL